jgi:hypothetical protein
MIISDHCILVLRVTFLADRPLSGERVAAFRHKRDSYGAQRRCGAAGPPDPGLPVAAAAAASGRTAGPRRWDLAAQARGAGQRAR